MNTRPTPISDRIVSQFRKGEATSDGLILTMEKLECERDEAREEIATMEIRHAAVMLHAQNIVDEANQFREQRDRLAEALERIIEEDGVPMSIRASSSKSLAKQALQSLTPNKL